MNAARATDNAAKMRVRILFMGRAARSGARARYALRSSHGDWKKYGADNLSVRLSGPLRLHFSWKRPRRRAGGIHREAPVATVKTSTTDAAKIIRKRFFEGKPDRLAELDKMRTDDAVAREVVELRTKEALTQRELAKLVGTSASLIGRLEDADYEGHSLAMLNRIAAALHRRVEIRFMPLRSAKHPRARDTSRLNICQDLMPDPYSHHSESGILRAMSR